MRTGLPMRSVSLLLFDRVEVLDFASPLGVFTMANIVNGSKLFELHAISEKGPADNIKSLSGLEVAVSSSLWNSPSTEFDWLLVPGGHPESIASFADTYPPDTIAWLRERNSHFEVLASVCYGSLILAQTGLLDQQKTTTHHQAVPSLRALAPEAEIFPGARYVDNFPDGNIASSTGVSAGIDLALYLVERVHGSELAKNTKRIMEYNPTTNFVQEFPC